MKLISREVGEVWEDDKGNRHERRLEKIEVSTLMLPNEWPNFWHRRLDQMEQQLKRDVQHLGRIFPDGDERQVTIADPEQHFDADGHPTVQTIRVVMSATYLPHLPEPKETP